MRMFTIIGLAALWAACGNHAATATEAALPKVTAPPASTTPTATRLTMTERPLLTTQASVDVELKPDRAAVHFVVESVSPREGEAGRRTAEIVSKVEAALTGLPKNAKLTTEHLTLTEVQTSQGRTAYRLRNWKPRRLGYRSRVQLSVSGLLLEQTEAVVRLGLAAGATGVEVTVERSDCDNQIQKVRIGALRRARQRASRLAQAARADLGTLYRIREGATRCETSPAKVLDMMLSPSDLGTAGAQTVQWPEVNLKAFRSRVLVSATVGVVYALRQQHPTPACEAPGEIHLGMRRKASVQSNAVVAKFNLQLTQTSSSPQSALHRLQDKMTGLQQALKASGATDELYVEKSLSLATNRLDVDNGTHAYTRVRNYTASVQWELSSAAATQTGKWLALAAEYGATSPQGPRFELIDDPERRTQMLVQATTRAMKDAGAMAEAGGQVIRSISQLRTDHLWLLEEDPLRTILEATNEDSPARHKADEQEYETRRMRSKSRHLLRRPRVSVPTINIHAPKLTDRAVVALGLALGSPSTTTQD